MTFFSIFTASRVVEREVLINLESVTEIIWNGGKEGLIEGSCAKAICELSNHWIRNSLHKRLMLGTGRFASSLSGGVSEKHGHLAS